jgi:lipopolysaccharide transport system ATP-binding protein
MAKVIKVEGVSKAYQLGDFGTGTVSHDLVRYWAKLRGKEDPFLKVGEVNDRTIKGTSEVVWSLRDLNFEIEKGDTIGIIGRNGAGKSTLLKLLSRVTYPTTGSIKIKGRVASLLEVGTGFHPELTGRENIYLNGAILGMRKTEIKQKFDEIVAFSEVERYIDTPVKRYSSGMYVRLAFAVAAHLESEILIVDEVLAVGDVEFQKKCLGKMGEVSQGEGRTVLFVSHNMNAVQKICNRGILLDKGGLVINGTTSEAIDAYFSNDDATKKYIASKPSAGKKAYLKYAEITDEGDFSNFIIFNAVVSSMEDNIRNASIDIRLKTRMLESVGFGSHGTFEQTKLLTLKKGDTAFSFRIPVDFLATGSYTISVDITVPDKEYLDRQDECLIFDVKRPIQNNIIRMLDLKWKHGAVYLPMELISTAHNPVNNG